MFNSAEPVHWVKSDVITPAQPSPGSSGEGVLSWRKGVASSVTGLLLFIPGAF